MTALRHKRPFSWDLRLQVEDAHTLRVVRCSKRVVQVGQNAWPRGEGLML